VQRAEAVDAILLAVDFSAEKGWRPNPFLRQIVVEFEGLIEILPADAINSDGFSFDPVAHFPQWRAAQKEWSGSKHVRITQILQAIRDLCGDGPRKRVCAEQLNQRGIPNLTGKPWTDENLRKFMGKYSGRKVVSATGSRTSMAAQSRAGSTCGFSTIKTGCWHHILTRPPDRFFPFRPRSWRMGQSW
jgi:hypothetical protein